MPQTVEAEEPMTRSGRLLAALCGLVALLGVGVSKPAQADWDHHGFNRPFFHNGFGRPFFSYGFHRPFYRYGFYRPFYYPRPWFYSRAVYVAPPPPVFLPPRPVVYAPPPVVVYHHRYHHVVHHVVVHHPQCSCYCCPT
jgi:hypothetical protein